MRGGGGQTQLVRLSSQLPLSLGLLICCLLHLFLKIIPLDISSIVDVKVKTYFMKNSYLDFHIV